MMIDSRLSSMTHMRQWQ